MTLPDKLCAIYCNNHLLHKRNISSFECTYSIQAIGPQEVKKECRKEVIMRIINLRLIYHSES